MNTRSEGPALAYLDPACTLTLREGLAEYRSSIPGLLQQEDLSPHAQELFARHDIAHVVFGCDTSIRQEAMIDTWTLFGSDVGVRAYLDYLKVDEAIDILRDTGWLRVAYETVASLPDVIRVYRRARKMHKRWPWAEHENYLDMRLVDIREELGIEVLRPEQRHTAALPMPAA